MQRDQATLLDILRAARLALEFGGGLTRSVLEDDLRTQSAVLHQLMLLGEGVKRLSDRFRDEHSEIPWRLIAGMRDRLIHGYDDVDLDQVWETVVEDLPELIPSIERLVTPQPPK
jgi:uncharacterized protein with HEPN domain